VRGVLLEGLVVAVAGAAVAFAANALSPRGLKLARDFFGTASHTATANFAATNSIAGATNTAPSPFELLAARLREKGIHLAESNEVVRLFSDPRRDQNLILFVDAREDQPYQQGHIPGAYQLDYYRPENYMGTLLPLCQLAEQIVVYCHGGDHCEDSEFAAEFLLSAHVPKEKLMVYGGGITEWETNRLPVEVGNRLSGQIRTNGAN
jgi:rhodanese-related sulfurtransferase